MEPILIIGIIIAFAIALGVALWIFVANANKADRAARESAKAYQTREYDTLVRWPYVGVALIWTAINCLLSIVTGATWLAIIMIVFNVATLVILWILMTQTKTGNEVYALYGLNLIPGLSLVFWSSKLAPVAGIFIGILIMVLIYFLFQGFAKARTKKLAKRNVARNRRNNNRNYVRTCNNRSLRITRR